MLRTEKLMFNTVVVAGVCWMLLFFLAGCPAMPTDQPIIDVVDNDEAVVMGNVIVEGNFNEAKALIDWNDIVAFQKPRVQQLSLEFHSLLKAAIVSSDLYYSIAVIDGVYSGSLAVPEGDYDVFVTAYDTVGASVFWGQARVEVVGGESSTMDVVLGLSDFYNYQFVVEDLPGEFGDYGYANLTINGISYYCSYSKFYPDWDNQEEFEILFSAILPVDFDGSVDRAVLAITDVDGQDQLTELTFSIFDIDELRDNGWWFMYVPYSYPEWLGEVDVNVTFQTY